MRVDHNFPVNQLIAETTAGGWLNGIAAAVWIPMHEMRVQDAQVRLMHLCDQAMGLEPNFRVNAMWPASAENPSE